MLKFGWTAPWVGIPRGGVKRWVFHYSKGNIGLLGFQAMWHKSRWISLELFLVVQ